MTKPTKPTKMKPTEAWAIIVNGTGRLVEYGDRHGETRRDREEEDNG